MPGILIGSPRSWNRWTGVGTILRVRTHALEVGTSMRLRTRWSAQLSRDYARAGVGAITRYARVELTATKAGRCGVSVA